jgi:C-lobe and N-lobe beta barrels of Tf-binding protein B
MKVNFGMMLLAGLVPALAVGGCSSDNNNGFISFAAMPKPGTSVLPGFTTEVSTTAPNFNNTQVGRGAGSVTLTVDSFGNVTALTIGGQESSVSFGPGNATVAANGGFVAAASTDGRSAAIVADYKSLGFNYQTFGVWLTGLGTGSGLGGAISAGAATPGGSIPITGTANYAGTAGGLYVDPAGVTYLARSSSALSTNFATNSVSFSTSGSTASTATGAALANPSILNIQGTLSYAAGSNDFSGPVSSSTLNGSARGQFYGPIANEAGGTFALKGVGAEGYLGAFGAK